MLDTKTRLHRKERKRKRRSYRQKHGKVNTPPDRSAEGEIRMDEMMSQIRDQSKRRQKAMDKEAGERRKRREEQNQAREKAMRRKYPKLIQEQIARRKEEEKAKEEARKKKEEQ